MKEKTNLKERCHRSEYDAVVIGSGPNGMAAAIVLAQKGMSVLLVEAKAEVGGGCRSGALTLPDFVHDICSAVHPLAFGSPFFRTLPLAEHGLVWVQPEAPFAHPFDHGKAVVVERSVEKTAEHLDIDGQAYLTLMSSLKPNWDAVCDSLLMPAKMWHHPWALAKFGLRALLPAQTFAQATFKGERAQGLFAGIAAHAAVPLSTPMSASIGLVLGITAHALGWPMPKGGAQKLSQALSSYLLSLGGEVLTEAYVNSIDDLPRSRLVLADVTPRQALSIFGDRLATSYRRQLANYKYGAASFKLDWALAGPIPWLAPEIARAGTVHLGGTLAEIAASELSICRGIPAASPFVLLAQPTLFDSERAPVNKHIAWAYCHVPNGSSADMTAAVENQIERFAPGFKKLILAHSQMAPRQLEEYNPNYVGGDINGGALIPTQLFTRPLPRLMPYALAGKGLYLCSSSTPPGAGVHGMCGYYAAHAAWRGWR